MAAAKKNSKTAIKKKIKGKPKSKQRVVKTPIAKVETRPIAKEDVELNKLTVWLAAGMAKVKTRLEAELPGMLKPERPASELAHLYGAVRDMLDLSAGALKSLGEASGLLSNELVPKCFERENLTSFTTKDGYRVTVSTNYRVSIKGDKKEQAYAWLQDNDLGELITQTVNASTLSAAGRKLIEEQNKELPEELFNAAFMPSTSLTKTKK